MQDGLAFEWLFIQAPVGNQVSKMEKYFVKFDSILSKYSCAQINFISLLILSVISIIDFLNGYEIGISIFLLIPISISAWYCGYRTGIIFSMFSAVIWFFNDYIGHAYINPIAPYWNATARLGFFLVTVLLINQLTRHLGTVKMLSKTDSLTGLLNVRGFTDRAEKLIGMAARHKRPLVLAFIDLDNFKKVNDELGHSEGDKVLQIVGRKFMASLRATDVAGRLGGDEFAIVLPETDPAGAKAMFETLRTHLMQEVWQNGWPISFSIGVASFDLPPSDLDEAIKVADTLMYRVKSSGKNSIIIEHYPADYAQKG
jgi:diguanylate cyclase (GGDEF)-like protein